MSCTYRMCTVWQGIERKVLLFCTCRTCPVCLPDVSGIAETRTLIGMQLSFDTYNFLYLKLTQKLLIYQIYVDCEHLLNSNLNMALLLSVGQNRWLTPKFLIELSACWKSFKSLMTLIYGELSIYFAPLWTNKFI